MSSLVLYVWYIFPMEKAKALSIGDRVKVTEEGARAHRHHHDTYADVAAKVPTPLARPVAELAKQIVFTFPKPGCRGSIVEVRERWWGQLGYDYLVRWDDGPGQSWHLSEQLLLTE